MVRGDREEFVAVGHVVAFDGLQPAKLRHCLLEIHAQVSGKLLHLPFPGLNLLLDGFRVYLRPVDGCLLRLRQHQRIAALENALPGIFELLRQMAR